MSRRDLVSVLVKVMGVYFIIRIVAGAPLQVMQTAALGDVKDVVGELYRVSFVVGAAMLGAVLCVSLIRNSDAVARWVCPADPEPRELGGMAFADWQTLGYNLVGLFLLVGVLPALVNIAVNYRLMKEMAPYDTFAAMAGRYPLTDLSSVAVKLLLGLYLFLGPRSLVRMWERLREARRFEDDRFEET